VTGSDILNGDEEFTSIAKMPPTPPPVTVRVHGPVAVRLRERAQPGESFRATVLRALNEWLAEPAVSTPADVDAAFAHLRTMEDAYRRCFPDGKLGPPREESTDEPS
jgi:hypothetical protein